VTKLRWKIAQWAERRWWRQYLKNKSVDDYLVWKKNYWQDFLRKINLDEVSLTQQKNIDLGCGPAGIFLLFDQATAVDPLLDSYDADLAHFSKKNYPNNTFVTTSLEDFSPTESYDTIFCINAINHVSDMQKGIAKLSECAHEKSTLVISIDAHNHNFLKIVFQLLPGDILHPHQYNLAEYQSKIEAEGWKIKQSVKMDSAFIFNYYVLTAVRDF
jgi:2-polyprenyl-6-hydroxyphenyl methylase/3-demethylubiquinone-9 3-methyltransferase